MSAVWNVGHVQEDLTPTDLTADKYGAPPMPEGLQSDSQQFR